MFALLRLSQMFMDFLVNSVVPFFTEIPDGIDIFYFSFTLLDGFQLRTLTLPWLFGNITIAEFVLVYGLLGIFGIRLIKTLWDVLPIA